MQMRARAYHRSEPPCQLRYRLGVCVKVGSWWRTRRHAPRKGGLDFGGSAPSAALLSTRAPPNRCPARQPPPFCQRSTARSASSPTRLPVPCRAEFSRLPRRPRRRDASGCSFSSCLLDLNGWLVLQAGSVSYGQATRVEARYGAAMPLADELGMRPLPGALSLWPRHPMRHELASQEHARAGVLGMSARLKLHRAMEMSFWLPQAEAALARVEGR